MAGERALNGFPIVVATELPPLIGFYRDVLGGEVVYRFPVDDPTYVSLKIGDAELGLGSHPDPPRGPSQVSIWFYVAEVHEVVRRARSFGAVVTADAEDQPWGERIARLIDPTGIEVIVAERIPVANGGGGTASE
ncbi:glyoxalase/bleomycin resistance/extradiol dioxygenase family protein [Herbiconiux sp. L3-i23]|uniref:VOC family protein n=1 Tax=Herbiconiux sp. L3-i23 TaxID=2905871 RepID=UPI0020570C1A|nr:VOC family protein [Herbiconiux sp. L3-i23]BDI22452.1 extradiol dioxygenase [Herbiconiux sp. L3-i23]